METPMNSSTTMTEPNGGAGVASVAGEVNEKSMFNTPVQQNASPASSTGLMQKTADAEKDLLNKELPAHKADHESKINGQIPSKDASPEEWANFYNQLGRPESAEGYELAIPEGDSGEFAKDIAPLLHQAGLSQTQAQELTKGWNSYVDKLQQKHQAQQEQELVTRQERNRHDVESLRHEWQGRYEGNLEQARRARQQFFPAEQADDIINAIENTIGVKATIQMLHQIGKGLAEDDAAGLQRQQVSPYKNAAEVLFDKR